MLPQNHFFCFPFIAKALKVGGGEDFFYPLAAFKIISSYFIFIVRKDT